MLRASARARVVVPLIGLAVLALTGIPNRAGTWLLIRTLEAVFEPDSIRFRRATGLRTTEVLHRLGEPVKVFQRGATPADYRVPGYDYPTRTIRHALWLYHGKGLVAYLYVGPQQVVEAVEITGS